MLKIAYYEENTYHTEILCLFLNYFGSNLMVYNGKDMSQWIEYYQNIFNFKRKHHKYLVNDIEQYDRIIIGTSSDVKKIFLDDIYEKYKNKFIFVSHLKKDLIYENNIVLTPLNKNINNHYLLPIFDNKLDKIEKKETIIGIIGRFKYNNRDDHQIINLIKKNNNKNFSIFLFVRK
jgi:hypothetical protein